MGTAPHLWAIGFDNETRAAEVRREIEELGWGVGRGGKYLLLLDEAVVVRHADGSLAFDRKPVPWRAWLVISALVGFLLGLLLDVPFTGALFGGLIGAVGVAVLTARVGPSNDFVRDVERLLQPGTSALLVVSDVNNLDVIRHTIQGLGGRVLKTNVDPQRASLIQETLATARSESPQQREAHSALGFQDQPRERLQIEPEGRS